ncbi:MAG: DnaD domain protein, partial [Oscillospiraceae bacterium]|nr:DnaD domain protein [Oscillospiraceae bacterium]
MDEKQFRLPDQETYRLSGHELNKLLRRADGNAALLYLYILREQGHMHVSGAMEALKLSEQEVYEAVRVLVNVGLLSGSDAKQAVQAEKPQDMPEAEELPQYTAAEIEQEMTQDPAFKSLIREVSGMLGRILTAPDLTILMGIYRHLGLPPEVIYQLVSHLTREHRDRYGPGKSPTLRGIEKIAYIWAREEILTLDAAMAHIAKREQAQSQIGQMKQVLDLPRDKKPTKTQETYLYAWLDMGFELEVLAKAYDKTVVATGSLKWAYMNAILCKWCEKGLKTAEAVEAAEPGAKPKTPQRLRTPQPQNVPDQQEVARRRRLL